MCFHLDVLLFRKIKRVIIIKNESNESMGIERKPNKSIYSSVQETPWLHGCMLFGMIPAYNKL